MSQEQNKANVGPCVVPNLDFESPKERMSHNSRDLWGLVGEIMGLPRSEKQFAVCERRTNAQKPQVFQKETPKTTGLTVYDQPDNVAVLYSLASL